MNQQVMEPDLKVGTCIPYADTEGPPKDSHLVVWLDSHIGQPMNNTEMKSKFEKQLQSIKHKSEDVTAEETISYMSPHSDIKSALAKHEMKFNHKTNYNDCNILYKDNSVQRLKIKESLAIIALKPDLNVTTRSIPFFVSPDGWKNKKKVKFKLKQN
ncbi:unnamed protein product [Rotaria sordida]|uniref:Uncharacterized protein n=1 Tax=Rotaria sordida TaxID=392033 RepID=A0A814Q4R3_9BILA|nr:unnamed protein product [Rotaria sordida]CAF1114433.1 unnamed protein product [Rotaria sordida]